MLARPIQHDETPEGCVWSAHLSDGRVLRSVGPCGEAERGLRGQLLQEGEKVIADLLDGAGL